MVSWLRRAKLLSVGRNAIFTFARDSELWSRIVPRIAILEIAILEIAFLGANFQTQHILAETQFVVPT